MGVAGSEPLWNRLSKDVRAAINNMWDRKLVVETGDGYVEVRGYDGDPSTRRIVKQRNAAIRAGDDVLVLRAFKTEVAICALSRIGEGDDPFSGLVPWGDVTGKPTTYAPQIIPYRLRSDAPASTASVSSYVVKHTELVTLPAYGSWGCLFTANATVWRSVASGEKEIRMKVGGVSATQAFRTADGLVMTTGHGMTSSVARSATTSPINISASNPTFNLEVDYRGVSTAGTTNISNLEISGFFYRIS
jgi:hypothetical protein